MDEKTKQAVKTLLPNAEQIKAASEMVDKGTDPVVLLTACGMALMNAGMLPEAYTLSQIAAAYMVKTGQIN